MTPLYHHYALLCISSFSVNVLSQSSCDAQLYGKPKSYDCFDLYKQLPGGTLFPDIDPDVPRSFVEPKFLDPPFTPVPNPYSTQMVQLPKIWRIDTCRCALMSIADASGTVHEPTSIDTWRTILDTVIDDVQECVLEGNAGGMHFANMDDAHAKVVYIYAVGSPFESILNRYMSNYNRGVDPDNPRAFLGATVAANSSVTIGRALTSRTLGKIHVTEGKGLGTMH